MICATEPRYAKETDMLKNDISDLIGDGASLFQKTAHQHIYFYFNPEKMVIESLREDDAERVKNFYAKLTDFERGILEYRRKGLTLAEVADKFKCHVTTVKLHLKKAKQIASAEFQVAYA
jgi:DNA-directed RNA polymerase specialized sigma24 family protein